MEGVAQDLGDELGVGLAAAIGEVRRELEVAIKQGKASQLAFTAGPIELQFELVFSRSAKAKGGLRVWVVSAEAGGELARTRTHRLTVSLAPVDRLTGESVDIEDRGGE